MRVIWHFGCDYGHRWEEIHPEGLDLRDSEKQCPQGHPVVYRGAHVPVDEVEITVTPMARELHPWFVDSRRGPPGKPVGENDYKVTVTSALTGEQFSTQYSQTWQRTRDLLERLRGRPFTAAVEALKKADATTAALYSP